jgi:hypothetical protein
MMKRPNESDYTSYVAYTRALEEYCDTQRTWVGLTDDEIYEIYDLTQEKVNEHWESGGTTMMFPPTLYKAIEAKLKEKNT